MVRAHDLPRSVGMAGAAEHFVARLAIGFPFLLRRFVDRRDLPLLERIIAAGLQPLFLLALGNVEIIFADLHVVPRQHLLERNDRLEEFLRFFIGAEAHDALDAGAVVPRAVEHHEFLSRWQERNEALEVPLRFFPAGGLAWRMHASFPWAHVLGQTLDGPVLAGGVAAFRSEEHTSELQ